MGLINIFQFPVCFVLCELLKDRTTGENILFATDAYKNISSDFGETRQITSDMLLSGRLRIIPRVEKELEAQKLRQRIKAEVFTPAWIVNMMNNNCDSEWFGELEKFNHENGTSWTTTTKLIHFRSKDGWKRYVASPRIEIACGEAPYIVSRYDTTTGELIPIENRIGILDRKLRVVTENTQKQEEWLCWAIKAFKSVYGYEYQGDSLLIARANLLHTFSEYLKNKWGREATSEEIKEITNIVVWNFWQMDGLTSLVPLRKPKPKASQLDLFATEQVDEDVLPSECLVYDWEEGHPLPFKSIKNKGTYMKFDFVIGNPPYQETQESTSDTPIYDKFMDAAFEIADRVEFVTPARFLFKAGKTPRAWNEKMLNDMHFKVLCYEEDSSKVFANTDIKGGVAITYRDNRKRFGAIKTFTKHPELNQILAKVSKKMDSPLSSMVFSPESYKFTSALYEDYPGLKTQVKIVNGEEVPLISQGHEKDLTSNVFDNLLNVVFFKEKPKSKRKFVQIVGRRKNGREYFWIDAKYIAEHKNFNKYKIFLPKANGTGTFGELLADTVIGEPRIGHTQTFISIGAFDTKCEAKNLAVYLKCKFTRAMLGILKVTQDNKKNVWSYVPSQDFTNRSDINWATSIHNIDLQLYKKYELSEEEIAFIEATVKEEE